MRFNNYFLRGTCDSYLKIKQKSYKPKKRTKYEKK